MADIITIIGAIIFIGIMVVGAALYDYITETPKKKEKFNQERKNLTKYVVKSFSDPDTRDYIYIAINKVYNEHYKLTMRGKDPSKLYERLQVKDNLYVNLSKSFKIKS